MFFYIYQIWPLGWLCNSSFYCIFSSLTDGFYRQVKQISGAHNKSERVTPSKMKKRRPNVRGMANGLVSFRPPAPHFHTTLVHCIEVSMDIAWRSQTSFRFIHTALPAKCHGGFVSRWTHSNLLRCRWWVSDNQWHYLHDLLPATRGSTDDKHYRNGKCVDISETQGCHVCQFQ